MRDDGKAGGERRSGIIPWPHPYFTKTPLFHNNAFTSRQRQSHRSAAEWQARPRRGTWSHQAGRQRERIGCRPGSGSAASIPLPAGPARSPERPVRASPARDTTRGRLQPSRVRCAGARPGAVRARSMRAVAHHPVGMAVIAGAVERQLRAGAPHRGADRPWRAVPSSFGDRPSTFGRRPIAQPIASASSWCPSRRACRRRVRTLRCDTSSPPGSSASSSRPGHRHGSARRGHPSASAPRPTWPRGTVRTSPCRAGHRSRAGARSSSRARSPTSFRRAPSTP
jgi:hypothetical protein